MRVLKNCATSLIISLFTRQVCHEPSATGFSVQLFGRQIAEFSLKDGALTAKVDSAKVTLQLQQDGFMRLTYEKGSETRVIYLMPQADPGAAVE